MLLILASCSSPSEPDADLDAGDARDMADTNALDAADTNTLDATESDASDADAGSSNAPNILLIISDDQGIDSSSQYSVGDDLPATPTLNGLAAEGIVFDQAWATPACTTTRGTLITGLHGVHSGIDRVPDLLEDSVPTLHQHLRTHRPELATAIIGKWHLGGRESDPDGPTNAGVGHYAGTITGTISDYESWPLTTSAGTTTSTTYHTSAMTDLAIDWVREQSDPWFLWLAYVAPHLPFHLPPDGLHERELSGSPDDIRANRRSYYLAAIEAMDHEIGRLLDSLGPDERRNTLVVFVGDNGTPAQAVDESVFSSDHAKNSLYEGGVRVPLVVSGAGVMRPGERDSSLINTADLWPTLAEYLGTPESATALDGQSFLSVFGTPDSGPRATNYTEFVSSTLTGWAMRDERYKLIHFEDGTEEFYDLRTDLAEAIDLIGEVDLLPRIDALRTAGEAIRE